MKQVLIFILALSFFNCNAQFFKPLPKPHSYSNGRMGVTSGDTVLNVLRPIVDISATVSNGTQLAGGFGVSFQHEQWNAASQSYVTVYSLSALGFLGTNGTKITGTAGLVIGIPGTNGIVQMGPGYDFTQKQWVILTGVGITFK